ncbi:hypothetical protein ACSBR1_008261 [Camellia fascicularis]
MSKVQNNPISQVETTSLLYELQIIWDEVGESEVERDKILLELEQEILEVHRKKVDQANRSRAQLRQEIADFEAELADICSAMGERPVHIRQSNQSLGSLKEEVRAILPQLEEMRNRKCDRRNQFVEVLDQIQKLSNEINMSFEYIPPCIVVDETDLSLRKLEELHRELMALQKEKSDRLKHVLDLLNTLNSLCLVLGIDFKETVNEVHHSLGNNSEGTTNISNDTIEQLGIVIQRLRKVKIQRMQQLQDLATSLLELWNLMDTPIEEQQMFQNVTCNIAASEHEITEPNMLSLDSINNVEAEVCRLEKLKSSKMKELVLKKRSELEEIFRNTHVNPESNSALEIAIEAIESGTVDSAFVLEQIELQIAKVKEEAFSRKDILEKVEKWLAACEEECWLDEYNMDENRYNAGRGAHLTLKRAQKARALVNKLPGMVEALVSKTTSWESERGIEFTYDGIRVLSKLEEYTISRQEKEQERKRQRDQKKFQGHLMAECSKPSSPMKLQGGKKDLRFSLSNKRLTVGGKSDPNTPRQAKKNDRLLPNDQLNQPQDDESVTSSNVNTHEVESPMKRKPFILISSKESSKSNTTNETEDWNRNQNDTSQKYTLQSNNTKEEENMTPKVMPSTEPIEEVSEDIEYSFEERRADFVLPRTHTTSKDNNTSAIYQ